MTVTATCLQCVLACMLACSVASLRETTAAPKAARARTWASFGIQHFHFVGSWNSQSYQATVHLRVVCTSQTTHVARMVVSLHDAPQIRSKGPHSETPLGFLSKTESTSRDSSSGLPQVYFVTPNNNSIAVKHFDWEELAGKATTAALMAAAELPVGEQYTIRMQGSERVHQVQQQCSPKQHHLFNNQSIYLGIVTPTNIDVKELQRGPDTALNTAESITDVSNSDAKSSSTNVNSSGPHGPSLSPASVQRFLTVQHLQHHMALGFTGSIMVVTPHTAEALLQSRVLRRAVQRQQLLLVLWDLGLEPRASHFVQIPAYNLMRLAAWGSRTTLFFTDLDEYLVLPKHRPIQQELAYSGCLTGALATSQEAIIPCGWVAAPSWDAGGELLGWVRHGRWESAVQAMGYKVWPYTYCDGTCKAFVDPNTDLLFQVHQHVRAKRSRASIRSVESTCAYLLHFYRLLQLRQPALMTGMGLHISGTGGVSLPLGDVLRQAPVWQSRRAT